MTSGLSAFGFKEIVYGNVDGFEMLQNVDTGFTVFLLIFDKGKLVLKFAYVLFDFVNLNLGVLSRKGKLVIFALGHGYAGRFNQAVETVKLRLVGVVLGQSRRAADERHIFGMKATGITAQVKGLVKLFKAAADRCKLHFFN